MQGGCMQGVESEYSAGVKKIDFITQGSYKWECAGNFVLLFFFFLFSPLFSDTFPIFTEQFVMVPCSGSGNWCSDGIYIAALIM